MSTVHKIKVLIIDDSALIRKVLRDSISAQPDMEVIAAAADPYVAVEKMKTHRPDVITLDIEMPRMDGLTFLRKLMAQHPIPVIILSSLSKRGSEISLRALEYGAVDLFSKDELQVHAEGSANDKLIESIRGAGNAHVQRKSKAIRVAALTSPLPALKSVTNKIVVMGASTGGTTALHDVVTKLPANAPGVVIVQHMPELFTRYFAERLNTLSAMRVKEAEQDDAVVPGKVLIAPGNKHVKLLRKNGSIVVQLWDGPAVNRHKPSVDVLFESAAEQLGNAAIGVLLTGMGKDGANGMLSMKKRGAFTIAQDEATSIVYGMPKEAVRLKAVDKILPLQAIPSEIINQ